MSEDEAKNALDEVQKLTDKFVGEVQMMTDNKEKEIMSL
ncbi:MAG TPA: ribosome recycling factor [Spirochaetota bacterium]|nr:ribosome recycling factor [Spirochaetota bacterium]